MDSAAGMRDYFFLHRATNREQVITHNLRKQRKILASAGSRERFRGGKWRTGRDSNPRDGSPPTPLAGERLRPLGHLSADPYRDGVAAKQGKSSAKSGPRCRRIQRSCCAGRVGLAPGELRFGTIVRLWFRVRRPAAEYLARGEDRWHHPDTMQGPDNVSGHHGGRSVVVCLPQEYLLAGVYPKMKSSWVKLSGLIS